MRSPGHFHWQNLFRLPFSTKVVDSEVLIYYASNSEGAIESIALERMSRAALKNQENRLAMNQNTRKLN
jgi:hypothetical protein